MERLRNPGPAPPASRISRSGGAFAPTRWLHPGYVPLSLFHLLLDRASEREQPLVDRGRYLADEFDHASAVLEDPGFPDQLIAEFIDRGLIGRHGFRKCWTAEGLGRCLY